MDSKIADSHSHVVNNSYSSKYDNSHALVIGINRYQYVNQLGCACADAESVASALSALDFPSANIVMLLDLKATRENILAKFLSFDALSPDDRLLVFFAGHGDTVQGKRGPIGYLIPVDGRPDDKSTLLRWDDLTRNADLLPAKHILFIMDACYSGLAMQRAAKLSGERRFITDMLRRFSRQVITAGKADQTVADGGGPNGKNSIFTGYLLEGLEGKASDEKGVLTAAYLMNYVYRKVSNDSRSNQTPHYGHLDGDGDFILRTPKGSHFSGDPNEDILVAEVSERPEPSTEVQISPIKPVFADKNGYADPEAESFGRNDWTKLLGMRMRETNSVKVVRPLTWLSLVVEPVSSEHISFDIANLAKTLPRLQVNSEKPWDQFRMPSESLTTGKAAILYDSENLPAESKQECWRRFLRIEASGAIEYCDPRIATVWSPVPLPQGYRLIYYVQTIGKIWSFLFAARRILDTANYQAGIRYTVSLIGTKDSILTDFAAKPGPANRFWKQPTDVEVMGNALQNWKCREANLQVQFKLVLAALGETEAKKLIVECASYLGLAYNHQSPPRCFVNGSDEFPWEEVRRE